MNRDDKTIIYYQRNLTTVGTHCYSASYTHTWTIQAISINNNLINQYEEDKIDKYYEPRCDR